MPLSSLYFLDVYEQYIVRSNVVRTSILKSNVVRTTEDRNNIVLINFLKIISLLLIMSLKPMFYEFMP